MIRADMIIAICALLISSLACAAAVLQTRVIGQQLSATVWPYLDYSTSTSNNTGNSGPRVMDETTISVTNDGLGPAIIKQAGVTIDGRRLPALDAAITTLVPNRKRINGSTSVSNITGFGHSSGPDDRVDGREGDRLRAAAARASLAHRHPDLLLLAAADVLDRARHRRAARSRVLRLARATP
jgi:hypothetical protein